jgi:putative transposase
LIINSDQGSQFTSKEWVQRLNEAKIKISMDGKGRCLDNIFIERFWRTLKYEEVYLKSYGSIAEARQEIGKYIIWYNTKRRHQGLGYITPRQAMEGIENEKKLRPAALMDQWKTLTSFPQAPQGQQQQPLLSS